MGKTSGKRFVYNLARDSASRDHEPPIVIRRDLLGAEVVHGAMALTA